MAMDKQLLYDLLETKFDSSLGNRSLQRTYIDEELKEFRLSDMWGGIKERMAEKVVAPNPHNCLVYWLLGIAEKPTELEHHYEAGDFPDVDVDIEPEKRDEIKRYFENKFGKDNCMGVVTYGKIKIKSAIQDLSRIEGIDPQIVQKITTKINYDVNNEERNNLGYFLETIPELREYFKEHPKIAQWIDKIQDAYRNLGVHASAYIISSKNIKEHIPILRAKGGGSITGLTESSATKALQNSGLIKYDLLGLRNLTVVREATELVEKNHDIKIDWDIVDYDDPEVYKLVRRGFMAGVFQFEKGSATPIIRTIRPSAFTDLAAVNSLIRPACSKSGMHVRYWEHKNGNFDRGEFPVWLDLKGHVSDFLFDMLEDTYGVPIYQEQTMQMLAEFIGINFEDTNPMRKIIGIPVSKRSKKHFAYLDEQKKKFIENGARLVGEDLARQWWDTAVGSLGYGFNAAHCFSYSTISYWQLWLKCYYPKEYYYSLIKSVVAVSSEKDNRDGGSKLMQYINEAKQLGVDIFAPEVNTSKSVLSLDEANIFIGLSQVKGVGGLAANQIVANQPYSDFNDFLQKNVTKGSKVNKRSIEALLHANAFRKFGEKPEIAQAYAIHRKEEYKPLSNIEYLIKEKDVLTIVLSEQNPIELPYGYRTYEKAINSKNGEYNKIIGIVDSVTGEMTSKNGNKYANIYLTDFEQNIKVFLWSSQFEYLEILKKGYLVKAKLKHMSDDAFMVTNIIDIIDLEDDEDE